MNDEYLLDELKTLRTLLWDKEIQLNEKDEIITELLEENKKYKDSYWKRRENLDSD